MDNPYKACSNQTHCTGTHLKYSLVVKFCHENTSSFSCRKFFFMGFVFMGYAFSEAGIIVVASPSFFSSTWIAPMFICMGERQRNSHPPFSLLPFAPFSLFLFSLTRNTEDTLLLHHNHSGMTIQCPAALEQSGNWVKTSNRIHRSLQISISQSMSPSGSCLSPQKSLVINWQVLTVSNSQSYCSRANNFIFIGCIEKVIYYPNGCSNTVTWHPSAFKA